jgi:hypothetical protein
MIKRENEAPQIVSYCSDSCYEGFDYRLTDPNGHNIRIVNVDIRVAGEVKEKIFVCVHCAKVYELEDIIKPQEATK